MAKMMPVQMKAAIDLNFVRSKSGAIWGRLFFQLPDDNIFPDSEWTDLVVAIGSLWLKTIVLIAEGKISKAEVPFYDGPYKVEVSVAGKGAVTLRFLRDSFQEHIFQVPVGNLLVNALDVGIELMKACEDREWVNADTERLEVAIRQAELLLKAC